MAGFNTITGDESIMNADNASFDGTARGGKMTTNGQLWIGSTASPHVKLGSLTSPGGTVAIGYAGPNITLDIAGGSPYISLSPYIVGPDIHSGYSTIAAAIAAAVGAGVSTSSPANIYVKPKNGGYTENNTLVDGINIIGFGGQVQVTGNFAMTGNGTASLSNLYLTTNSDYIIALTGSNSPQLNVYNCYFNCSNHTSINYTAAGGGAIFVYNSNGNLGTTGIAYFTDSSAGKLTFIGGVYQNNGGSSTASTNSGSATTQFYNVGLFGNAITISNTGILGVFGSNMSGAIIANGTTGADSIMSSNLSGATASALSIGAGATCTVTHTDVSSSNTNAITGSGILRYAILSFSSSSSTVNTSTRTALSTLL